LATPGATFSARNKAGAWAGRSIPLCAVSSAPQKKIGPCWRSTAAAWTLWKLLACTARLIAFGGIRKRESHGYGKGSDGRWLVDGKPVVVETTRDEDGLMYQSANIPDEDVASLVESHTFVDVQNQHGEQVQLSFCMDGWSLLVKDEKELRLRQCCAPNKRQNPAAPGRC
jgi:hypothetical protein